MGARRIAFTPRLDLAVRAGVQIVPRAKLRPYVMVSRKRATSLLSKKEARTLDAATYGKQTSYLTSGAPGVISILMRSAKTASGFAGGGAGGGFGGGGGQWPESP